MTFLKKYNAVKARKDSGFTLLELLLVVGVGAVLLLAGIATFNLVTTGNNVNEGTRLLTTLKQQMQRSYEGQASYGTDGTDLAPQLVSLGAFPNNAAEHPWNGAVVVTGAGPFFTIQFTGLDLEACLSMVQSDAASDPDFRQVEVGSNNATERPSLADANTLCGASGGDVVWSFF